MGGNTLGHKSMKEKSLKEEMEEESFLLMVVYSLKMFWFVFLGFRCSQRHKCMDFS